MSHGNTTHGASVGGQLTREYRSWRLMKRRCSNKNDDKYRYYGGRGIRVCTRWRRSFTAFLADMGRCPPGRTLDRIDNDRHYMPGNCRWATRKQQANNRRPRTLGGHVKDLTGQHFARLYVLRQAPRTSRAWTAWICRCACGNVCAIRGGNLRSGHTLSCGCLKIEKTAAWNAEQHARSLRRSVPPRAEH